MHIFPSLSLSCGENIKILCKFFMCKSFQNAADPSLALGKIKICPRPKRRIKQKEFSTIFLKKFIFRICIIWLPKYYYEYKVRINVTTLFYCNVSVMYRWEGEAEFPVYRCHRSCLPGRVYRAVYRASAVQSSIVYILHCTAGLFSQGFSYWLNHQIYSSR